MASGYASCRICPRECGVDRTVGSAGFCSSADVPMIAHYGRHDWEEPPISGHLGSGTVFFSGCNLRCSFCQNRSISASEIGLPAGPDELAEIFLELGSACHNINLVTAAHHLPAVAEGLRMAKDSGLAVPVVYNTSSYEKVEAIRRLEGLVDIYLPDLKYVSASLSSELSSAPDYFEVASKSITEMLMQVGHLVTGEDGIARRGVLVRHLVLPGQSSDSISALEWIRSNMGRYASISIMSQYTPDFYEGGCEAMRARLTAEEYSAVINKAEELGFQEIFSQEPESASAAYVPHFNRI